MPSHWFFIDNLKCVDKFHSIICQKYFLESFKISLVIHDRSKVDSRHELLQLRFFDQHSSRLPENVWKDICSLGIAKRQSHRGKRAGRRKQRRIPVHTTTRSSISRQNAEFCLWNARSLRNKAQRTCDYILEHDIDIFVITETWLKEDDQVIIGECTPPGYTFLSSHRKTGSGGGISVISKCELKLSLKPAFTFTTFEIVHVVSRSSSLHLFAIYRPPPSSANGFTLPDFMGEFDSLLTDLAVLPGSLLMLGDFNFHVDIPTRTDVQAFLGAASSAGLHQHVTGPTHIHGHTLDLDFSRIFDQTLYYF